MTKLFIDTCTSYQPYTYEYYKKMRGYGVLSNFIKVSEATNWEAPNWTVSFNNSLKAGIIANVYHFMHTGNERAAQVEADFFASKLKAAKLDKRTKYMVDCELPDNNSKAILAFIARMKAHGFNNACVYASRSYWTTKLTSSVIPNPWVAGYGVTDLGISNAKAWQYNNKFKGYNQDINKDLSTTSWFTTTDVKYSVNPEHNASDTVLDGAITTLAHYAINGYFGNGVQRKEQVYTLLQEKINKLMK